MNAQPAFKKVTSKSYMEEQFSQRMMAIEEYWSQISETIIVYQPLLATIKYSRGASDLHKHKYERYATAKKQQVATTPFTDGVHTTALRTNRTNRFKLHCSTIFRASSNQPIRFSGDREREERAV